jgi:hypothetical protein
VALKNIDPESSDKNYNMHVTFNKNLRVYDNEFDVLEEEYKKRKKELKGELDALLDLLRFTEEKYKTLKLNIQEFTRQQKNYYYEILKKGIDVRSEGLCWVIKKLIELNAYLDASYFPRFLDRLEIDYLLDISYKETDHIYLSLVLKALKKKQVYRRSVIGEETFNSTGSNFKETKTSFNLEKLHIYQKKKFCERMVRLYDNINNRDEDNTNFLQQVKLEDGNIDVILQDLIKKIKSPNFLDTDVNILLN